MTLIFTILLTLLALVVSARADTLVAPQAWTMPATVIRVTPADVPDSAAWGAVYKRCPAAGCVVELGAGTYSVVRAWKGPGLLVVRGAAGARARIGGGAGCGGHKTAWAGVVLIGLDFLPGSGEITSLPNCDFIRLDDVTITGKTNNGVHLSNSGRTRFEIVNSTVTRSGQGNTKHNLYIGRIPSALAVNLTSHSSKGSHAFKAIARAIEVRDSWFGTVGPGQTVQPGDGNRYVSTTLMDIASCAQILVENVTLDHVFYDGPKGDARHTGNQVMAFRNRNSIYGCDEPPYGRVSLWDLDGGAAPPAYDEGPLEPANDNDSLRDRYMVDIDRAAPYWTPGFWSAPEPAAFIHRLVNVRFIERGQAGRANAITEEGTAPVVVSRQFGPALKLPAPEGWVERSLVDIGAGVTFGPGFRAHLVAAPGSEGE